jgi:two-component system sensor histidine kinase CreC
MTIARKIFFGVMLLFLFGGSIQLYLLKREISPRYREAVEEPLVDLANLFAEALSKAPSLKDQAAELAEPLKTREVKAKIYGIEKSTLDIRATVTDEKGIVLYDSNEPENVGKDFSQWKDIALTLRGEYGARTTRDNIQDPTSTVLQIAAPIKNNGVLRGVVSIGKPTKQINKYIERSRDKLYAWAFLTCVSGIIVSTLLGTLFTTPLRRLTAYAEKIGSLQSAEFPRLPNDEVGLLGKAFERMRISLEGRKYIEEYVQALTHELKSPLTGLQGALEIIESPQDASTHKHFIGNMRADIDRMGKLVERLLELSSLEATSILKSVETFSIKDVVEKIVTEAQPASGVPKIHLVLIEDSKIKGDRFLIEQTLRNLVDNAVSFARSKIILSVAAVGNEVTVDVVDDGDGIPDFAQEKLFQRFFSLPRPGTGKKSSGLGLCFVKEVVRLHGGSCQVSNNETTSGVRSRLVLPVSISI